MTDAFRTGYVAIVGRPNVGKSTLTNRLIGMKVSITSRKAQTTRHRIQGILTSETAQLIFVDTPGFQTSHKTALNRAMNRNVKSALADVNVVLFVVEAGRWGPADRLLIPEFPEQVPVVLVINKIDRFKDKAQLLPFIAGIAADHEFAAVVPLSAEKGDGTNALVTSRIVRSASLRLKFCVKSCFVIWVKNYPMVLRSRLKNLSKRVPCVAFMRQLLLTGTRTRPS